MARHDSFKRAWQAVAKPAGRRPNCIMGHPRLIAGAMSGTSADGVDVAIVAITGRGQGMSVRSMVGHHLDYPAQVRNRIFACRSDGSIRLSELAELARSVSLIYAQAINQALTRAGLTAGDLCAVAAHGQTLYHQPPCTIQWLDPALIAAQVGAAVVSDFRRADCAAGGQGAPLVPFADFILFRDPVKHRVLLNLGGIANITHLPAAATLESMLAFDTGPANCISDFILRQVDPTGPGYDRDGGRASQGSSDNTAVDRMLDDPYFHQPPPRSTDGPAMISIFQKFYPSLPEPLEVNNRLATACALTARSIARAIQNYLPRLPDELIASGGGIGNAAIMSMLQSELPGVRMLTTDQVGVAADMKEAIAFAVLAAATLDGEAANVPRATGAARPVVLGSITPAQPFVP